MKNEILIISAINEMAQQAHDLAKKSGWHPSHVSEAHRIANFASNMHGEVSEFWEAHRSGSLDSLCDKAEKMIAQGLPPLTCREEELADQAIRVFDEAIRSGVEIGRVIVAKHRFNTTRPHRHGGKKA